MNSDFFSHFSLPLGITGVFVFVICVFALCGVNTSIADTIMILAAVFGLSHLMRFAYLIGRAQGKREATEAKARVIAGNSAVTTSKVSLEKTQGRQQTQNPSEDFC